MSWQPYLDLVKKPEGVQAAGIFGQNGATWAADASLKVSADEAKALVAGVKDNSKFQASGIHAAGVKYMYLRALSDTSVIGKKGGNSIIIALSKQAVIVLLTKEGANPGNITSHEFVATDLIKKNF